MGVFGDGLRTFVTASLLETLAVFPRFPSGLEVVESRLDLAVAGILGTGAFSFVELTPLIFEGVTGTRGLTLTDPRLDTADLTAA